MTMIDKFKMGRSRYSLAKLWSYLAILEAALIGDLVIVATPTTLGSSAAAVNAAIGGAAAKFTRQVTIELQNAAGDVHTWFNGSLAIAVAEVTAGSGVSAIAGGVSSVTFVEGVATVTLEYTGAWAGGVKQVETQQITHKADAAGTITVTVTSAGMTDSPKAVAVEVGLDDTASEVAALIVEALNDDAAVAAKFTASVTGAGSDVVTLTAKAVAANDGTLAMGFVDTDTTGVAAGASTNATAGVAADTQTLTITGGTILGYAVTNKTSVDTLVA